MLVAEALQRAAMAANNGSVDSACAMLTDVELMVANSPSTIAHDPLSEKLLEVVNAAIGWFNEVLSDCKCRSRSTLVDKSSSLSLPGEARFDRR